MGCARHEGYVTLISLLVNALKDAVLNCICPSCLYPYSLTIFFSSLRLFCAISLTSLFVQKGPAPLSVKLLFRTHSLPVTCLSSFRLLLPE